MGCPHMHLSEKLPYGVRIQGRTAWSCVALRLAMAHDFAKNFSKRSEDTREVYRRREGKRPELVATYTSGKKE